VRKVKMGILTLTNEHHKQSGTLKKVLELYMSSSIPPDVILGPERKLWLTWRRWVVV
jgi:hypothetical protein